MNLIFIFPVYPVEVITDPDLQLEIIQSIHSGIGPSLQAKSTGGHQGINRTRERITKRYFWPRIKDDVGDLINRCHKCQVAKKTNLQKATAEMHPVHVPNRIWTQIGIDMVTGLPKTEEGYVNVLYVIDYFTKWVEMLPCRTKSGHEIAYHLYRLICRHGCPEVIISDQGPEFNNAANATLFSLLGVEHRVTAAYHPQVILHVYYIKPQYMYLIIVTDVTDQYLDTYLHTCNIHVINLFRPI